MAQILTNYRYEILVTLVSFVGFHVAQYLARLILKRYAKWYRKLSWLSTGDHKGQLHYETVVISFIHCMFAVPLCTYAFFFEGKLSVDPIFGTSFVSTTQFAISLGYFVWDLSWCAIEFKEFGFAFTVHGFFGGTEQIVAMYPFMNYYACFFLLFETSTLFMDIHWFFEKTMPAKHPLVLLNGAVFVLAFLGVRTFGGTFFTYHLWRTIIFEMPPNTLLFARFYVWLGSAILWCLNSFWIVKILRMTAEKLFGNDEHPEQKDSYNKATKKAISKTNINGKTKSSASSRRKTSTTQTRIDKSY